MQEGFELVVRRGYHGTGISDIVEAADVPKGSFYNHFESKAAFVATLIDRYGTALREGFEALLAAQPTEDPLQALIGVYRMSIAFQESAGLPGCLIGNLAAELGADDDECNAAACAQMKAWAGRVTALLEDGQARGRVRGDRSAAELAAFFWDAWEGALLRAKVERTTAPLERTLDLLHDFLRPIA